MRSVRLKKLDSHLLNSQRNRIEEAKSIHLSRTIDSHSSFYAPLQIRKGSRFENGYLFGYVYHCKFAKEGVSYWKEKCTFFVYPEFKVSSVVSAAPISERDYVAALNQCCRLLSHAEDSPDFFELFQSIKAERKTFFGRFKFSYPDAVSYK